MQTKTSISNLALSHLAVGKEISSIETENSEEARVCRRFYDIALRKTLREFIADFSTRIIALPLIESDPNSEWGYSYRYPNNCLLVRRILSGVRNDNRQSRIPFKISSDNQGRAIWTDQQNAEIEYTHEITDPNYFPDDFILAFSYYLAFLISPRVTGGDQFALGKRAFELYHLEINKALAQSANESQVDEEPDSQFIRERG